MKRALACVALIVAVAGLGACGSSSGKSGEPSTPAPIDLTGKTTVEIAGQGGNQWSPAYVKVDAGTKVTWINKDSIAHNVKKSADAVDFGGEFGVDAGQFNPGDEYSFTFATPGTYPYVCTIHAGMDGSVTVVAGGAATTTPTTAAAS